MSILPIHDFFALRLDMIMTTAYPLHEELSARYQELLSKVQRKKLQIDSSLAGQNHLQISYEVIESPQAQAPYLILANGLGGRLYTWLPIIEMLNPSFNIMTWDYRGLFDSQSKEALDRIDVAQHAEDLLAILNQENIKTAHLCGWSMGVQVSLEFSARNPTKVESLILINGTFGQVFSTAFQPFVRLPLPTWLLHEFIEGLKKYESLTRLAVNTAYQPLLAYFGIKNLIGLNQEQSPLILLALKQYMSDLLGDHLHAYLSLFQHLDAHNIYHLLPKIDQPTLIISGGLDFLTPPYQSKQIARRMKQATYQNIAIGTHFVLLERTDAVKEAILKHFRSVGIFIQGF